MTSAVRPCPSLAVVLLGVAVTGSLAATAAEPAAPGRAGPGNPIRPEEAADPHLAVFGHRYYVYPTRNDLKPVGFVAWSSDDLITWSDEGQILRFGKGNDVAWCESNAWAPAIAARNGRYYFYYSADSRIGVAVGDSPVGPFKDPLGKPLVPFKPDISVIDPQVFVDDDGQAYLYYGAVPASWLEGKVEQVGLSLSVRKLGRDMVSLEGEEAPTVTVKMKDLHIEGSLVFKRNGVYYFMWSAGNYDAVDDKISYRVNYATSRSPMGPWAPATNNPVLFTDHKRKIIGPGHHGLVNLPGTDEWVIAYHAHRGDVKRRVHLDRMSFAPDGTIRRIEPTLEGITSPRAVAVAVTAAGKGPYAAPAAVALEATCTWDSARVRGVEFFANGKSVGRATAAPYRVVWRDVPVGFYRVTARATDADGTTAVAAPIDFDVVDRP
jgi:hypothetical protein